MAARAANKWKRYSPDELAIILDGSRSNREVAKLLGRTPFTISSYRWQLKRKLQLAESIRAQANFATHYPHERQLEAAPAQP